MRQANCVTRPQLREKCLSKSFQSLINNKTIVRQSFVSASRGDSQYGARSNRIAAGRSAAAASRQGVEQCRKTGRVTKHRSVFRVVRAFLHSHRMPATVALTTRSNGKVRPIFLYLSGNIRSRTITKISAPLWWPERSIVCLCQSLHLSVRAKLKTYLWEINVIWLKYVLRWIVKVIELWWYLNLTFNLESYIYVLGKKITYN